MTSTAFQSTPSQRGRHINKPSFLYFEFISIHALAKRATKAVTGMPVVFVDFNPRPRKEGDFLLSIGRSLC